MCQLQVKVKLPVELKSSHHLLFTFSHIACDLPKATKVKSSTKLPPVESIGTLPWWCLLRWAYIAVLSFNDLQSATLGSLCWMTTEGEWGGSCLCVDGGRKREILYPCTYFRISGGPHNLLVSASLPSGYLGIIPPSPQSSRSGVSVHIIII